MKPPKKCSKGGSKKISGISRVQGLCIGPITVGTGLPLGNRLNEKRQGMGSDVVTEEDSSFSR